MSVLRWVAQAEREKITTISQPQPSPTPPCRYCVHRWSPLRTWFGVSSPTPQGSYLAFRWSGSSLPNAWASSELQRFSFNHVAGLEGNISGFGQWRRTMQEQRRGDLSISAIITPCFPSVGDPLRRVVVWSRINSPSSQREDHHPLSCIWQLVMSHLYYVCSGAYTWAASCLPGSGLPESRPRSRLVNAARLAVWRCVWGSSVRSG